MVNFHDPIVIAREYGEVYRFWGLMDGIFIWEFMITLDYEWSVIRGRRPYRWTIWIYSLIRVATLATVALNIFSLDATTRINCQVAANLQFIFAYLALATSSLLIVLRIIAIWDRKKVIVAFATGVWGINVAFLIQGVLRFRSSWEVDNVIDGSGCVFYLDSIRLSTVVAFAADIILLLIMLFGLYRLRRHGSLMGLGRLLWNQGVVWFLLAVVTELTPTLLIFLNLSQPLDLVFQVPWVITMSVAATRMYRSLSDFLSSDISQKILPTSGRNTLELNGTSTTPVLLTGIQVAVHTTHEQRFTPQANHFGSNIGGQPHGKPHELIVDTVNDHDIEGRAEK
ncbi:hypothetical protein F5888DRAFT_411037 [Russula emetica]|nr:hypothetical protein F5888DRAFT_411037 [Russula emetica]